MVVEPGVSSSAILPVTIFIADSGEGRQFLFEHSSLIGGNAWDGVADDSQHDHEGDWGQDFEEGAAWGTEPQDEILAHERAKVTSTLCHT